jgi:hypothetical protein
MLLIFDQKKSESELMTKKFDHKIFNIYLYANIMGEHNFVNLDGNDFYIGPNTRLKNELIYRIKSGKITPSEIKKLPQGKDMVVSLAGARHPQLLEAFQRLKNPFKPIILKENPR